VIGDWRGEGPLFWWGEAPESFQQFRKGIRLVSLIPSATPLRPPSRTQRIPSRGCFVLVLVVLLVLDLESGDTACCSTAFLNTTRRARLGAPFGVGYQGASEINYLRESFQAAREPRPTKIEGIAPPITFHQSPITPWVPAHPTTRRVSRSSGQGQNRNNSTQVLLMRGCKTERRANWLIHNRPM
jgi:hypothetical protein